MGTGNQEKTEQDVVYRGEVVRVLVPQYYYATHDEFDVLLDRHRRRPASSADQGLGQHAAGASYRTSHGLAYYSAEGSKGHAEGSLAATRAKFNSEPNFLDVDLDDDARTSGT